VEGTDTYNGTADVTVTDGFVGNVVLKVSEGVAEATLTILKEGIQRAGLASSPLSDAIGEISRTLDYSEYGGAPLLGVDGICIICHGKSKERAIKNAILQAKGFIGKSVNERIKDVMRDYSNHTRTKEH
jgi:glycerol-3-phosphate acyltransferase PlsX